MSDSVRPHGLQPTRLPRPWDSPGKNTGVGCHFLLQCMKVESENEVAQLCPTLSDPMGCRLPGSSIHGTFQARVLEWGAIAFSSVCSRELEFYKWWGNILTFVLSGYSKHGVSFNTMTSKWSVDNNFIYTWQLYDLWIMKLAFQPMHSWLQSWYSWIHLGFFFFKIVADRDQLEGCWNSKYFCSLKKSDFSKTIGGSWWG